MGLPEKYRPRTSTPSNVTVVPRFAPSIFTPVEPPVDPTFGEIDATDGAVTIVGPTVDPGIDDEPQPTVPCAIRRRTIATRILIGLDFRHAAAGRLRKAGSTFETIAAFAGVWSEAETVLEWRDMLPQFFDSVLSLVVKTSTDLPPDVRAAMKVAVAEEPSSTQSGQALAIIAENIDLAADCEGAICQDTGMPTFEVKTPVGANQLDMRQQIRDAVAEATRRGKLRPNSVDSITGENSGNNLGPGTPIIHFDQWERDEIEVKLILKGGGCENMNAQYSLPMELPNLGRADRTLEGVRARRSRRLRRRRSHVRLCARERAVVPHAR